MIVAPGRGGRPHAPEQPQGAVTRAEYVADCPFCAGNEDATPPSVLTLPEDSQAWSVRVVPNRFPAVSSQPGTARGGGTGPLYASRTATGVHEVVVETPLHNLELPDRNERHVDLLLEAFQQRLVSLLERPTTRHVAIFKNEGLEAGTSLEHPHSQIVGLGFLPADVIGRAQFARRFHQKTGDCVLCTILHEERRGALRIVFEADGFVAFAPYASASAGETLLVPVQHAPSFALVSGGLRIGLGRALAQLLDRCRTAFDDPPYNLVLHTAPKRWLRDPALHWYWQLSPRLSRIAGFELGTGVHINTLAPEDAASMLRSAR